MANSPAFVAHALDLLSLAGPVLSRRMFGGHGLYLRGAMFALLDDDELFLKTDDETRARFVEAGCAEWVWRGAPPGMRTSYFRPPDDAHEDPEAMLPWARLAIEAAERKARQKALKEAARRGPAAKGATPAARTRKAARKRPAKTRPKRRAGKP